MRKTTISKLARKLSAQSLAANESMAATLMDGLDYAPDDGPLTAAQLHQALLRANQRSRAASIVRAHWVKRFCPDTESSTFAHRVFSV